MFTRSLRCLFALVVTAPLAVLGCAASSSNGDGAPTDPEVTAATASALVGAWAPIHPGTAIPGNAFPGGSENGHPLYVCRANFNGGVHPGKVVGTACAFGYGGAERWAGDFEVLLNPSYNDYRWVGASPSTLPGDMLVGGSENGQPLYVCRASYYGLQPGKLVNRNCNFSYGGVEKTTDRFDVVVQPCGHAGEACCFGAPKVCPGNSASDDQTLQCNNGRCESCGDVGLKCCTLNKWYCPGRVAGVNSSDIVCQNDQCVSKSGGYCSKKITCTIDCRPYGGVTQGQYCSTIDAQNSAPLGCAVLCG